MRGIKREISQYLSNLPPKVKSVKDICEKYIKYCSIIDGDFSSDLNGKTIPFFEVYRIGHNPNCYWDNYMFTLNNGIDPSWVTTFKDKTNITIPKLYEEFLLGINGCHLFDMMLDGFTLFGLPPEKYYPPLYINDGREIPRGKYAGVDLETENTIKNTKLIMGKHIFDGFYIGNRNYNDDQHYIGFFISGNEIVAINGDRKIMARYDTLEDFLSNEIKAAEDYYFSEFKEDDLC